MIVKISLEARDVKAGTYTYEVTKDADGTLLGSFTCKKYLPNGKRVAGTLASSDEVRSGGNKALIAILTAR